MARAGIKQEHWNDANGNPEGGVAFGNGFAISWQHGPLGRDGERKEPNGAFVEDIIQAAIGRIEFYQKSKFASEYNANALTGLKIAAQHLHQRTLDRENRCVEGTHKS